MKEYKVTLIHIREHDCEGIKRKDVWEFRCLLYYVTTQYNRVPRDDREDYDGGPWWQWRLFTKKAEYACMYIRTRTVND